MIRLSKCTLAVIVFLLSASVSFALVHDEPVSGRKAEVTGNVRAKVNSGNVLFKRGSSSMSANEFLKQKADKAEAEGASFFCDAALFQAARMMLSTAEEEPEGFGFICFRNKSGRAYLAAAGGSGSGCVFVEAEFSGRFDSPEKGADDGLRRMENMKRILSVEVAGGFTNIYTDESTCVEEALAFYSDTLKKGKWKYEIRSAGREGFVCYAVKGSKERTITVFEADKGISILVAG